MAEVDFLRSVHTASKRDYLARVVGDDKAHCAEVAGRFGADYWDGERCYGYGGYRYDGRWRPVAEAIARQYDLRPGQRVLDVGCGKAFLLYELTQAVPGIEIAGLDISDYALAHAKAEVRPFLTRGTATALPYPDDAFDLVLSMNVLHNLFIADLVQGVREIERVGRANKVIIVESYRSEREKVNLLYWQLTCRAFHTPEEWRWLYELAGYAGDHGFIFFE